MEPTRSFKPFQVVSEYQPSGDQPRAIAQLADRLEQGESDVVLLGATGTGKSATTAWLIEKLQRPTLVLAHNKTLAAQLANEFRQLLPHNAVEYFVSYYDYYQPEAYVPQTDTFIEKDTSINAEVERLGHSTTNALLSRRDVVVVASVSCIYGLGKPEEYYEAMLPLAVGDTIERDFLIRRLIEMQYQRNDIDFSRGNFRVRGDTIEIIPMYEELAIRIEMFGDEIERLSFLHPLTGDVLRLVDTISIFPGSHYVARRDVVQRAMEQISAELEVCSKELKKQQKLVEEQRLRMRTTFDLEMMEEIGFCSGMENYSMHMDGRSHGEPPNCLLDYFPDDFLTVIDESHVTVPQLGAMYEGDAARKRTLVEHGFRLPSALDNRPLKFAEFTERIGQVVYLSATPGKYELERADGVVEQIIRPTGLVDPEIIVKPSTGQIDDLLEQVRLRTAQDERVLVTTLTKKMAEQLTDFMEEAGIRVRYLHSDVDTLKRVELLSELRAGVFDVLIGINLLREGLDLPEVSLVAILDADKEGFLRSTTSLIQTIGRAARNVNGQVHMYADRVTKSMQTAIEETNRRREIQLAHNKKHGINPTPLRKKLGDITEVLAREAADTEEIVARRIRGSEQSRSGACTDLSELERIIKNLTEQMLAAAEELKFELAGRLRDELQDLKRELKRIRAAQK
ncbi:excinuclease ABC subunit UvrB [Canibacter sp. lx-72]|uniref:excinuclease ABC subunit UvrB n=1 Tax=Canibacter zhuwentaonis TaxID=2837491 RepID=UPI001BDD8197|nr:excinuclease ABC subunit UvrB [Canibacter zhuwentaonis]MBT1018489.1 excinuclease ABC subunit UvrB [Canibacter zhuwentaonis]